MINQIRAEFLKIKTVRSSYVMAVLVVLMAGFLGFWVGGYKATSGQLSDPELLYKVVLLAISSITLFPVLVAMLQTTHEYRYNTIMHTLTAANSRLKVLAAKLVAALGYTVLVALLTTVLVIGAALLGVRLQGAEMTTQNLQLGKLLGYGLFYTALYSTFGLLIAVFLRNQVAAIATLLVWPTVVESLATLLLKTNAQYLPFKALDRVISDGTMGFAQGQTGSLSVGYAMLVTLGYALVGGAVAIVLFVRRDAN